MNDEHAPKGPPDREPLPPRRAMLRLLAVFAALAVVLGLVGWFAMTRTSDDDLASPGTTAPGSTIALPLVPVSTTTTTTIPLPGDDEGLVAATAPEFVITFSNIGRWRLGAVETGFETHNGAPTRAGECGMNSVDDDGIFLTGTTTGVGSAATIDQVAVGDERYRTASGVGVGTTVDGLRRVYADRLVIDELDGWESPTDGLLASYSRVAGVREAGFSLTFVLGASEFGSTDDEADTVISVEVNNAESWGDDEGCA